MKIHNDGTAGTSAARSDVIDAQQRAKRLTADRPPAAERTDSVETSTIAAQGVTDPAKIERLREAVRNGTYSVPAKEIAASLVRDHLKGD